MRKGNLMFIACLFLSCATFFPSAQPIFNRVAAGAVQTQSDNGPFSFGQGRFFIDGKAPRGFTEFEYLYLEGGSFKLSPDKKRMVADSHATLTGELYKGRRTFKLKRAAMEGDALTFESQAVNGVSFQFSGVVFNEAAEGDNDFVIGIKGRLSKLMNGKKVAEALVTFSYLEPED